MSKKDETTLPVKVQQQAIATYSYGEDAGAGFENTSSEDTTIPFLGVIQPMSPEVAGDPGKRVKGAVVGMLINTVTKELFDGGDGVIFQPASTKHVFVEWKPRTAGGGFVAVHELDSPAVVKARAGQEFGKYKTDAGNDLIETYYMAGLLHRSEDLTEQTTNTPEPILLAFTSTKIKAYKQIMTRLMTFKGRPPLFAHRLKITSASEKNNKGQFENFHLVPLVKNDIAASLIPPSLGDQPHPLLVTGKALGQAYNGGEVQGNHDKAGASGGASGGGAADVPF